MTGTAEFIGFHLAKLLLSEGHRVHGYDGLTDYYDVNLKRRRHAMLKDDSNFTATAAMLEDQACFDQVADDFEPDIIIHLAAQAGVRYSLENPRAYLDANIIGTFTVMEAARRLGVRHVLMASTSSVYGGNTEMPFTETEKADTQLTIYAATKKACESMGHAYAHLWNLPTTMFRFFTVYGPWGRPDLALYKFVDAVPARPASKSEIFPGDSLSPVAPFRVVNIGNSDKVRLLDFIEAIEDCLGVKAVRNYMPMQVGDVPATWADTSLLEHLTGYRPQSNFREGIAHFVTWFREYSGR